MASCVFGERIEMISVVLSDGVDVVDFVGFMLSAVSLKRNENKLSALDLCVCAFNEGI